MLVNLLSYFQWKFRGYRCLGEVKNVEGKDDNAVSIDCGEVVKWRTTILRNVLHAYILRGQPFGIWCTLLLKFCTTCKELAATELEPLESKLKKSSSVL
jgi:hypothetical protein